MVFSIFSISFSALTLCYNFLLMQFILLGENDDKENFAKSLSLLSPYVDRATRERLFDEYLSYLDDAKPIDQLQGAIPTLTFLIARACQKRQDQEVQKVRVVLLKLVHLLNHTNASVVSAAVQVRQQKRGRRRRQQDRMYSSVSLYFLSFFFSFSFMLNRLSVGSASIPHCRFLMEKLLQRTK
jgi:hypothetical protein